MIRAIIQARIGSARLRGKSLMLIGGTPLLEQVIFIVKKLDFINEIMVATTNLGEDDSIELLSKNQNVKSFRGSATDVLERFYESSLDMDEGDSIVRFTAEGNPLNFQKLLVSFFKFILIMKMITLI